jgi:hypothetical protein
MLARILTGELRVYLPASMTVDYTIAAQSLYSPFHLSAAKGPFRKGKLGPEGGPAPDLSLNATDLFGKVFLLPRAAR